MTSTSLREGLLRSVAVRWAIGAALAGRGGAFLASGRLYRALDDFGWVVRASGAPPLAAIGRQLVYGTVKTINSTGRNPVIDSYRRERASAALAASYSLNGGPHELLRDLIVLKAADRHEKGVILLKYVRTFDAVVSMFELDKLMARYTFALEPCWSGYCDPSLLMFVRPGHPVVVQCFTEDDHRFVSAIGGPLVPVRLGPADWVDTDIFTMRTDVPKQYDLVMVANWASHKRHATLFRALSRITDRRVRVLLIGFPWGGRSADNIRREAAAFGNDRLDLKIVESIPAAEVAHLVSQSRVFVFLSPKEGDNKALVEAMFANVPSIVYDRTVGGAGSRINPATGVFSSDEELGSKIEYMLEHYATFTPRQWALKNSGSTNATRLLNDALRQAVTAAGGGWTTDIVEKTNSPNLAYKDQHARARFQGDYDFILGCRRHLGGQPRDAVA